MIPICLLGVPALVTEGSMRGFFVALIGALFFYQFIGF